MNFEPLDIPKDGSFAPTHYCNDENDSNKGPQQQNQPQKEN
jgi:hypothetical protein